MSNIDQIELGSRSRCLPIQTGIGPSASELVRIKFVEIMNYSRGKGCYLKKNWIPRDPNVLGNICVNNSEIHLNVLE